jgi:hypothetical protein
VPDDQEKSRKFVRTGRKRLVRSSWCRTWDDECERRECGEGGECGENSATAVDLDGEDSLGHFVDKGGDLKSVRLTHGEALAIERELREGADSVGYGVPVGSNLL